jgi:hypothetical protein
MHIGAEISQLGIVTGYGLDDREVAVQVPVGLRTLSSPRCTDRLWGAPNFLSNSFPGFSPGVKRPGRGTDNSSPNSAKVRKMCFFTSIPPFVVVITN